MFGWFRKKAPEASLESINTEMLAAKAVQGMPPAEHIRSRALPQLLELLDAEITRVEAAAGQRFSDAQKQELRSSFSAHVLGTVPSQPKRPSPAPIAEGDDHLGHVEGIIAQAFSAPMKATPEGAMEVAVAAREAAQHYLEKVGNDDPALKAAIERAIAEHMAAVLR